MDVALYVVVAAVLGAAVTGSLARTWSFHRRIYALEDRLSTVEGITTREVKIRAATSRTRPPSPAEEALALALANPKAPSVTVPWYAKPSLLKGGFPPSKNGNG